MPKGIEKKILKKKAYTTGRPGSIDEGSAKFACYLFSQGDTHDEVCKKMGISTNTLTRWMKQHEELKRAVKEAKSQFDDSAVVKALHHRATGYEHKETKVFCHEGMIVTEDVIKRYPPDTRAAEFWLSNRNPDKWSRKLNVEMDVKDLSDDQLIEKAKSLLGVLSENTDKD